MWEVHHCTPSLLSLILYYMLNYVFIIHLIEEFGWMCRAMHSNVPSKWYQSLVWSHGFCYLYYLSKILKLFYCWITYSSGCEISSWRCKSYWKLCEDVQMCWASKILKAMRFVWTWEWNSSSVSVACRFGVCVACKY